MYALHYAPDNASMIVRLVLEGAMLPYRPVLVDRRAREQDSADFRALNPAGLIPVLETQDGPISETGAILLWLGDRHGLCPAADSHDRAHLLRWLFFLSNTAHADLRQLFYHDQYVPEVGAEGHHALIVGRMRRHFALLEHAAHEAPVLWQPDGILLPYVAALARWAVLYPRGQAPWFALSRLPLLAERLAALEATPAAHVVARAEGLGAHPFTLPVHPQPSEGSAT